MSDELGTDVDASFERAPIELRAASVDSVDYGQRLITVIAVPYEQETSVAYRGELWKEVFTRGAFDGVIDRPNRIRVNRDHDKTRTVGKVVEFLRSRSDGLVSVVRVAKTPLGDETLALADEDCLSASVGAGVLPRDLRLDRSNKLRRVDRAFLDHISFVEDPAYSGAKVLSVRDNHREFVDSATLPPLVTPNMDDVLSDYGDILQWASNRPNKQ